MGESVTSWIEVSAALVGAYALGCLATGYYLVRALKGVDIRAQGSGNAGARNVGRVLGRTGFVLTTLGDAGKGALAIWVARRLFQDESIAALALLAVTAGHIWPVQLRFRGGKGVATSLGALCVYDWRLTIAYLLLLAPGLLVARKTVLPGILAFAGPPAAAAWLSYGWLEICALVSLTTMIFVAHRTNLIDGVPALAAFRDHRTKAGSIE